MAPVGSHRKSFDRAAKALELRARRLTWQEIADELGFRSRQGAQQAVVRLIGRRTRSPVVERAESVEKLRMQERMMFPLYEQAVARGDEEHAAMLAKELRTTVAEAAKLDGHYSPQRTQVDVNVKLSAGQIIDDARRQLLDVLDAEVVDVKELETRVRP